MDDEEDDGTTSVTTIASDHLKRFGSAAHLVVIQPRTFCTAGNLYPHYENFPNNKRNKMASKLKTAIRMRLKNLDIGSRFFKLT